MNNKQNKKSKLLDPSFISGKYLTSYHSCLGRRGLRNPMFIVPRNQSAGNFWYDNANFFIRRSGVTKHSDCVPGQPVRLYRYISGRIGISMWFVGTSSFTSVDKVFSIHYFSSLSCCLPVSKDFCCCAVSLPLTSGMRWTAEELLLLLVQPACFVLNITIFKWIWTAEIGIKLEETIIRGGWMLALYQPLRLLFRRLRQSVRSVSAPTLG